MDVVRMSLVLPLRIDGTRGTQVCLGEQKRGPHKDLLMPPGGKCNDGEPFDLCARRECTEEIGALIKSLSRPRAVLNVVYETGDQFRIVVFTSDELNHMPKETAAMKPRWYDVTQLPWERMPAADPYWMPILFGGHPFEANIRLGTTIKDFQSMTVRPFLLKNTAASS